MVMGSKRKMKPVTVEVHRSVLQMTQTHHSSFTLATPITSTNKVYFSPPPSFPDRSAQIYVVMPAHANWLMVPSAAQEIAATAPVNTKRMEQHAELQMANAT